MKGAVAATTGFLTGPILIILIIAMFMKNFAQLAVVQHAFAGIRVCVCVLILQAVLRLWKKSVVDPFTLGLYLAVLALHALGGVMPFKIPAAALVILAGVAGILAAGRKNRAAGKAGEGRTTDSDEVESGSFPHGHSVPGINLKTVDTAESRRKPS